MKFKGGEAGPGGIIIDDDRVRVMEPDRGPMEALREDDSEDGSVGGGRIGGCWRIRRRPEAPIPCSCSVMTGGLEIVSYSATADPASNENRIRALSVPGLCARRFPVLRFLGR